MKKYRKMLTTMAVFITVTLGAFASPVYYTIFHALEEESMDVFTAGGSATISVSEDGGNSYRTISSFKFDGQGRGFSWLYALNQVDPDALVKLDASFNEGANGQPEDTVVESSLSEFLSELMPYPRFYWLTYAPVYVSYETLPDIVDTAVGAGKFNILVKAVQTAGLEEALRGDGPFTVFAPTDEAFTNLLTTLKISPEQLLGNPELGNILSYHVLNGALDGDAVAAETHLETLLGKDVDVRIEGEELFINNSKVVMGNIEAANGIIHVIDEVLLPPTLSNIVEIAVNDGRFTTLVTALTATGLDTALTNEGPFTVFAPTDAAFELLGIPPATLLEDLDELANILLYHVVEGRLKAEDVIVEERLTTLLGKDVKVNVTEEGVFINDALVIIPNIKAENGIIHVIDAVLLPEEMPNIVEVAITAKQFSLLIASLELTGLDEVLKGDGPYTVFAPTDEAFGKLPGWVLRFLLKNPAYLEQVLLYHVVAGDLLANEVLDQGILKTVQGNSVKAKVVGEDVFINRAKVVIPNVDASNGTIHAIDQVLLPWFGY